MLGLAFSYCRLPQPLRSTESGDQIRWISLVSQLWLCVCCPASAYHNHNIKLQTIQLLLELCKVISNFRKNIYYAIVICFWILIYIILQISISDVRGNRQSRGFIQTIM